MTSPAETSETYRPFMGAAEYSQLKTALWSVQPKTVLEWGSGGSTQTILRECPFIENYVSIEHDPAWHARIKAAVTDPRLALHLVEAQSPEPPRRLFNITKQKRMRYRMEGETDPTLFRAYAEFPKSLGMEFDFILVDGRARCFCLEVAWELLRPGGVLVLHDAQRPIYHPILHRLGQPLFLEPWQRGQICVIRKSDDADALTKAPLQQAAG